MKTAIQPGHVFTVESLAQAQEAQRDELAAARARNAVLEARRAAIHTLAVLEFRAALNGRK